MSSEVPDGLLDMVKELLAASIARDADRCADLTAEILDQHGPQGLYATCCGLAAAFVKVSGMEADDEDMISLENPDGAPEDDPELWAGRFLVAVGNHDHDTALALFKTRLANEAFFATGLSALLRIVSVVVAGRRP